MSIDVRELISLEDAMEELDLGPNGCVKIFAVLSLMMLSGDTVTVWGVQGIAVLYGIHGREFARMASRGIGSVWR